MCAHNYDCKYSDECNIYLQRSEEYSKREVMNWIDGNHLISLFNNVNISCGFFFALCASEKALLLFKKCAIACLFVHFIWSSSSLSDVVSFRTLLLSRKNVDRRKLKEREGGMEEERLATDCISMHLFHLFMIPFLNRKKGILFVRNRLFYLQVFM